MGGGMTEFPVYLDGAIQHSGVIAFGGDHIIANESNIYAGWKLKGLGCWSWAGCGRGRP